MTQFTLAAAVRDLQGKGASRRLRHESATPAIVYGGDKPAQSVSLVTKDLAKVLESEAFFSSIIELNIDGTAEKVVLKALQRHPVKNSAMHLDFLRVSDNREITVRIPLHFKNADSCKGVKSQGGRLSILMNEIVVRCLPSKLPSAITVDLETLESGSNLLMTDLALPEGVSIPALIKPQNRAVPVAKVTKPRGGVTK